ncbi:MAG: hypothetical protein M1834_007019 [Cirrosporium novae-zelandiae]|nr:MAG: hypothetical protein M1834_007019 [Cirrosporium novae-zelandiae]
MAARDKLAGLDAIKDVDDEEVECLNNIKEITKLKPTKRERGKEGRGRSSDRGIGTGTGTDSDTGRSQGRKENLIANTITAGRGTDGQMDRSNSPSMKPDDLDKHIKVPTQKEGILEQKLEIDSSSIFLISPMDPSKEAKVKMTYITETNKIPKSENTQPRRNHGQIGFDLNKLQELGALEYAGAQEPTLDNEIYDIWDKVFFDAGFIEGSTQEKLDEVYETIKPALRLASLWITREEYVPFWNTLLLGEIKTWEHDHIGTLKRFMPYPSPQKQTPETLYETKRSLLKKGQITFLPIANHWSKTIANFKSAMGIPYPRSISVMALHEDWFHVGLMLKDFGVSQRLRFYFFLAVNLCHILVHFAYHQRLRNNSNNSFLPISPSEPCYFSGKKLITAGELGIAWEYFMFAGTIQQINQPLTPLSPFGLAHLPFEMAYWGRSRDKHMRITAIDMEWIHNLFCKSWWEGEKEQTKPGSPGLTKAKATVLRTIDHEDFLSGVFNCKRDKCYIQGHV